MPKRVAEVGEGKDNNNGHGVYSFIRDLIVEGKDARFVNKKGRYVINWTRALKCYNDYKSKKNPQFKSKNIDRRKASNGLRSALLNFYKKEGAKEYKDGKKVNDKEEVIERQFQMPPRVLESLFGSEVQLSDDGSENETNSMASEADEKPQVTPTSSDTGFEEAMDISDDWFNSIAEPSSLYAVGDLPVDDSLLDNIKTEEDQVDPSDITTPCQMFDISEEEFDSALGEICSNSDNDVDLLGVVQDICPSSGSVKGGLQFLITLTEELPEDDKSGIARFDGIGDVHLDKLNPFTLAGIIPASQQPGPVPVTVSTQAGRWLGMTYFLYVDEIQEVLKQLVKDPALQSLYFAMWSQEYGIFGSDDNTAQNLSPFTFQDQGSSIQTKHSQGLKVLQLLVYTAAQTNAEQFIQMIFSTSVGKIVFNTYKGRTPLPEDVARANGHDNLAQYLQDVNTRLSKEIDTDEQTSTIDWLELSNAVNKVQKQSAAKDGDDDNESQSKDDDNQSDYFADVETSSCGSFELDVEWSAFEDGEADVKVTSYIHTSSCGLFEVDVGWSDSDDGEGTCSKDREPRKELRKKTKSSLVKGSLSKKPAMLMVVPGVETQADYTVDKNDYDDENYKDNFIVKGSLSEKPAMLVPEVGTQADHAVDKKDYDDENYKETSFVKSSLSEKPAILVPEVETQADHAVDKKDNKNYKDTSIVKGALSKKPAMLVPGVGTQADHAVDKKDYDDDNYKETSFVKSSLSEKPAMLVPEVETQADHAVDKQDYDDENFKETSIVKGSSSEKPVMLVPGVGSQAGHAGDKKDYDNENYKDTSTVNSKPGRKLFSGYGLLGWLYKWRQSEATATTEQEACADETQEKQSFTQRIFQKYLFRGGRTQPSEDVTSARGQAKAFPSQEKTAKPKRHKQRGHWRKESLSRERYVLLTIALVAVLAGLKIGESQLLHWAVGNGYTGISKVLMKCGLFVDAPNFFSETPLHVTAKNGFKDLAELLMQFGSNVNAKTYQQQTPLHLAAWSGQQQVAEVLMQHGSDLKAQDDLQRTALHLAATNGHKRIAEILIQRGIDVKAQDGLQNTALHYAAQNGHQNALEVLIQQGSDVNAGGIFGNTPLHLSALNGHQQSTEVLIQRGSDVNAISVFGKTPLHLASEFGYRRIVELLIQRGSDVTARDGSQQTPLHVATKNGHKNIVELLIQRGSDVTVRDSSLETALHLAAKNGHTNIVELLIQRGSDVNAGSVYGLTPLHLAARNGHKQIVEMLMRHGSSVNARDDLQQTALHLAAKTGHKSIAEFLIQHGCHVSTRNIFGETPLHLAAQNGHRQFTEFLIQHGSDVKAQNQSQQTTLHFSAENGRKNTVEVLLGHRIDVNARDDTQRTALHLAAENGDQDIFELLVQYGGDVNAKNKRGQSALHLASKNGHKNMNISILPTDIITLKMIAVVIITIACMLLGVCIFVWERTSRGKVCFQEGRKLLAATYSCKSGNFPHFKCQSVHDEEKIRQVPKVPLRLPILHLGVPTVHLEKPTIHLELTVHRKVLKTHHKVTTNNIGECGDLCTEDFTSCKMIQEEYTPIPLKLPQVESRAESLI